MDDVESESKRTISPQEKEFLKANEELKDLCEKILAKDKNNILALYFLGVYFENKSTYAITIEGKPLASANLAKEAQKHHDKVLELDKNLVDAKTSSAVPEYIVGSFNWILRGLALLINLHGDKKGGTAKLEDVAKNGIYRKTDAKMVLGVLEVWKGDPNKAIKLFDEVRSAHPLNFMLDISLAAAYEEAGKYKEAIDAYEQLLKDISSKSPGLKPGEIHFRIGKCYVNLRDNKKALEQFQKALDEETRSPQTKPLANIEMAHIIEKSKDDKDKAKEYYRKAAASGVNKDEKPLPFIEKKVREAQKKSK